MSDDRRITTVYTFANGQCMVFDQHGKQMPEYQGRTEEKLEAIRANFNGEIKSVEWVGAR